MIGRASIGYPWIFNEIKHFLKTGEKLEAPTIADRVDVCRKHVEFSVRWKGERLGIVEMRRHYASYFKGIDGAKAFRNRLVQVPTLSEVEEILQEIAATYDAVPA